jgi:hypothetical protein
LLPYASCFGSYAIIDEVSGRTLRNWRRYRFDPRDLGGPSGAAHEDLKVYGRLRLEIARSIQPKDMIEWLWIRDILDLSWEIRRLRGFKTGLIKYELEDRIKSAKKAHVIDQAKIEWLGSTNEAAAYAFDYQLPRHTKIDALLASAESRRNAVLHEIERRRDSLVSRLRAASDDIIEGEFTDVQPDTGSPVEAGAEPSSQANC